MPEGTAAQLRACLCPAGAFGLLWPADKSAARVGAPTVCTAAPEGLDAAGAADAWLLTPVAKANATTPAVIGLAILTRTPEVIPLARYE